MGLRHLICTTFLKKQLTIKYTQCKMKVLFHFCLYVTVNEPILNCIFSICSKKTESVLVF